MLRSCAAHTHAIGGHLQTFRRLKQEVLSSRRYAALTLPDINQALAKLNGRLLPLGWARFLLAKRKIDTVRVFALGVKPEYQHTGIAAAFYIKHLEAASPDGVYGGVFIDSMTSASNLTLRNSIVGISTSD